MNKLDNMIQLMDILASSIDEWDNVSFMIDNLIDKETSIDVLRNKSNELINIISTLTDLRISTLEGDKTHE